MPHDDCTFIHKGIPDDLLNSHIINQRRLKVEASTTESLLLLDGNAYLASGTFRMNAFDEFLFLINPEDVIGIASISFVTELDDLIDIKQYTNPADPVVETGLSRVNLNQDSINIPQTTVSKLSSVSNNGTLVAETVNLFSGGGKDVNILTTKGNLLVIKNIKAETVRLAVSVLWYERGDIQTTGYPYTFPFTLS